MQVTFLEASQPLTKTFHKHSNGEIAKSPYPMMGRFTSHTVQIHSLIDMFSAVTLHAEQGHCLLKGNITREIIDESRRGTTSTNAQTEWMCLDFDRLPGANIQDVMDTLGLSDISYIVQHSASSKVFDDDDGTISAHIFFLLDTPIAAPSLKAWLMEQNLKHFEIRLSRTQSALSWPMDITVCQNDKLIYIAPPKFIGMKDPFKGARIEFVKRKLDKLPIARIAVKSMEAMKKEARAKLNELRSYHGLDALRSKTTIIGEYEVQNKPDECVVTEIRNDGEFVRLNLNGGDSWAYWHPVNNFELVHDFKTGISYKTKELLPGYYQDLMREQDIARATPTKDGDLVLGFCDIPTAKYYKGLWNPEREDLRLWPARNEKQIGDWYMSNGLTPPDFVPQWTITFDPRSDVIVDEDTKVINRYKKSIYFDVEPDANAQFPTIKAIIQHAINDQGEVYEHFINWFACIFQRKHKPLTAWVWHGDEGTGKGFFFNKIARPLLNASNCYSALTGDLEEKYNEWMENKSFILVDEVDVNDFKEKGRVTAKLRNYITEPFVSMRRMQTSAQEERNWTAWLFSSNKKQPVFIPPGDRRYNVGCYQPKKLGKPDEALVESELQAFAQFLKAHPADTTLADSIIDTQERREIAEMGVTSPQQTANAILDGNWEELMYMAPSDDLAPGLGEYALPYKQLIARLKNEDKITRDELFILFEYTVGKVPSSPNKLTAYLKHYGIRTKRIRKNNVMTYGIDVEWRKKQ